MPIRQPVQTTIHASDFRDKSYCFEVESVVTAQERVGMLTVSTSVGYLLTTTHSNELKREQTVNYIQQTDNSWIAKGIVTLLLAGDSPANGSVIIRNALAETVVLTINVTPTGIVQAQQPTLTVSQTTLAFPQTSPGKPSFLILRVAQPQSEVPVTLTTNAPEYFQLASDSRPIFSPALTLAPSSTGTYVHVQYSASKNGFHKGELTIQNRYEKRVVVLEGRSSGLLPALRSPLPVIKQTTLRLPTLSAMSTRWIGLMGMVILSGLGYAGYTNRCQFFPALCPDIVTSQASAQTSSSLPAVTHTSYVSEQMALNSVASKRAKIKQVRTSLNELPSQPRTPSGELPAKQITSDLLNQERSESAEVLKSATQRKASKQENDNQPERQTPPATPVDESELEQELNHKPDPS